MASRLIRPRRTGLGCIRPFLVNHGYARHLATASDLPITRLSGAGGALIHNVDLTSPLPPQTTASIRSTLLTHGVIFFRQPAPLSPDSFLNFANHFGTPQQYPFVRGLDTHREIIRVRKLEHETTNFGGVWHADTTYLAEPPMGTILMAEQVPTYGGDTLFANQYLAYEALSDGLKATLAGLKGVSTSSKADASKTREDRIADSGTKGAPDVFEAVHPVVRTHPETGRKALYVNVAHTARFEGWTEKESEGLLRFLHEHQVRPEFTCRFVWEPGSIAFWDNRAVLHNPINDYHGFRRDMLRITLKGDVPR
ncbi:uncharacterized protein HMPREF1541_07231 [Cyphellophora europaea CBS 101466]|uniref:TauD/TfdA-like domain-containing protein n=1 Tax=Cyphellophora europaea (strain CBS 101466) TaxID=1220924 RepID=W2RPF3_CYPE1|nr:uncharacterized protein HMPREF1541_07231 [Cyphellophora europaea CBS 101466]ETN37609.1 hypothetical protein HMPREF1541_07231 [Cyphellophora europaea CBS 101466]